MRSPAAEASGEPVPTTAPPLLAARLPVTFDPAALADAMDLLAAYVPVVQRHYLTDVSAVEEWGGLSLHAIAGDWRDSSAGGPGLSGFRPTELLRRAPYFQSVLDAIPARKMAVRISILDPGGHIKPHRDRAIGFEHGWLRLHVPIRTFDQVSFRIEDLMCRWQPGELWYGDFSRVHEVRNGADAPRIHLVLDVAITSQLLAWLPSSAVETGRGVLLDQEVIALSSTQLERFACTVAITGRLFGRPLTSFFPKDWNPTDASLCRIEMLDSTTLALFFAGEPRIALEPIGSDTFRLVGGTPAMTLAFETGAQGVEQVVFRFAHRHAGAWPAVS